MILKDREDGGAKLAAVLLEYIRAKHISTSRITIVSLLRGGVVVGDIIAKTLAVPHLVAPVAKVRAPHNPELALGAVCFDVTYLEKRIIDGFIGLKKSDISQAIRTAEKKSDTYALHFHINKELLKAALFGRHVVLVDDGIATGATMRTAALFAATCNPASVTIAAPIILNGFSAPGSDIVTLQVARGLGSISQAYHFFPQIGDAEVEKYLRNTSTPQNIPE